jgi:signal peptidase I
METILTPDEFKNIRELKVGDIVIYKPSKNYHIVVNVEDNKYYTHQLTKENGLIYGSSHDVYICPWNKLTVKDLEYICHQDDATPIPQFNIGDIVRDKNSPLTRLIVIDDNPYKFCWLVGHDGKTFHEISILTEDYFCKVEEE